MNLLAWLPLLCAVAAVVVAGALGRIQLRRDFFFLVVYVQSVVYLDVSPSIVAQSLPFATADSYLSFQWVILALFQLPLLVLYSWRRTVPESPAAPESSPQRMLPRRAALFFGASLVLAVGYYYVGIAHGLLYRRAAEVTNTQLELSLVEIAFFRVFTEIGAFLAAAQLIVLNRCDRAERRGWMLACWLLSSAAYLAYALVNSRMVSVLFICLLYGVQIAVSKTTTKRPRMIVMLGGVLVILLGLYSLRVAANIRQSEGAGGDIFAAENFLPFSVDRGGNSDPLSSRLNGLDLIVLISPNVESFGPAWGGAWAIPFVVSLDPIIRTDLTEQAKRVALTTAKSFLLLTYAGIATPDYYNCMLSDAYGNFGNLGFLIAAIILALCLAGGSRRIAAAGRPAAVILGTFVLTRSLAFEQEFGALLFGWLKVAPIVIGLIYLYPLRTQHADTAASAVVLED